MEKLVGLIITAGILSVAAAVIFVPATSVAQTQAHAPRYEADPYWPKPLPERWVLGGLGGVCVDAQDHVFILNRQDVIEGTLNGGNLAPPFIELDTPGYVGNSWGYP